MTISARRRLWGWFFFDWASQPYSTLLLTFIFGPYFAEVARARFAAAGVPADEVAAQAQAVWTGTLTLAGLTIAAFAPVLGAVADGSGNRMAWIRGFSVLYVVGSFALWWTVPGGGILWPAVFFAIGLFGMEFATIFTNALMPHLAVREEMGRVSGTGFAFGYAGGVVALALVLVFLAETTATGRTFVGLDPIFGLDAAAREGTRAVGPFTAIWYAVFMVPFFLWVRVPGGEVAQPARQALARLGQSLKTLPRRPSLFSFLGSSMFYRDALNAIYGVGGVFASSVLGWDAVKSGTFGIIAVVTAAVACWAGGRLDDRLGPKPVIVMCIVVLIGVCIVLMGLAPASVFGIATAEGSNLPDLVFYVCGAVIGASGGILQAASRTLMVLHTDPDRAAEAFGLYGLSGKATTFLGPGLITLATYLTGSARMGIFPLVPLLIVGLVLLIWVQPRGDR